MRSAGAEIRQSLLQAGRDAESAGRDGSSTAMLPDGTRRFARRILSVAIVFRPAADPCKWDMLAPEPGVTPPITSLADARSVFHRAFAGLGSEYQAAFDALLDPANGRADILPGGAPNRYGGGFSVGFPGSTSILFFGRYDGISRTSRSLRTKADMRCIAS